MDLQLVFSHILNRREISLHLTICLDYDSAIASKIQSKIADLLIIGNVIIPPIIPTPRFEAENERRRKQKEVVGGEKKLSRGGLVGFFFFFVPSCRRSRHLPSVFLQRSSSASTLMRRHHS